MKKTLLINGPNLNLLGKREPEKYGHTTLREVEAKLTKSFEANGMQLVCFQSNHEGDIIDFIHNHTDADYAIINAGALTHTSIAIVDALCAFKTPFIEVHVTNIHAREEFRHHSYFSAFAKGIIIGFGVKGYELAANQVIEELGKN